MPFDSQPLPHKITIASDLCAAREVEDQIVRATESLDYSPQCAFAIRLALEEAMVNAHRHGNRSDASKRIFVTYDVSPERTIVRVRDEGAGFNPASVPDPTTPDRVSLPAPKIDRLRCATRGSWLLAHQVSEFAMSYPAALQPLAVLPPGPARPSTPASRRWRANRLGRRT